MAAETGGLHLVRLHLDPRKLIELGRRRRLPLRDVDTGYLAHCMLGELFGEAAPRPFAISRNGGRAVEVLAYSDRAPDTLRHQADAFADPWLHSASDWDAFAAKPMPAEWAPGSRVGFAARVCPVVRISRGSTTHRPGAELDAFLARCEAEGQSVEVSRDTVYSDWFRARIPPDAARLVGVRMEAFALERLVRRKHDESRSSTVKTRPEVRLTGELEVVASRAFNDLLRRGVGRHRSFGFGMLLLRPPRS